MKYKISATNAYAKSSRPVWFIAGDDDAPVSVVPWYDSDGIEHAVDRMIHCGYVESDYTVVEVVDVDGNDGWCVDGFASWWLVETRSPQEQSRMDRYRHVVVPDVLKQAKRFPDDASTGWWKRGVDDACGLAERCALVVYELMGTDSAIARVVLNDGGGVVAVAGLDWNQVKSIRLLGAKRIAILCWVLDKHHITPQWKPGMTEDATIIKEYERIQRKGNL